MAPFISNKQWWFSCTAAWSVIPTLDIADSPCLITSGIWSTSSRLHEKSLCTSLVYTQATHFQALPLLPQYRKLYLTRSELTFNTNRATTSMVNLRGEYYLAHFRGALDQTLHLRQTWQRLSAHHGHAECHFNLMRLLSPHTASLRSFLTVPPIV